MYIQTNSPQSFESVISGIRKLTKYGLPSAQAADRTTKYLCIYISSFVMIVDIIFIYFLDYLEQI